MIKKSTKDVYDVFSPDGFTIDHVSYATRDEAERARDKWITRYTGQGYYSTASRERIPLAEIKSRCAITLVDPDHPCLHSCM